VVPNPEDEEQRSVPEPAPSASSTQPLTRPLSEPPSVSAGATGAADADPEEAQRLREQVAELHGQLDTRGRRHRRVTRLRGVVAALLVVVAALGLTASVIGVWAGRTTLNTDRWVETVTPLDQDPAIRAAVSTYVTSQVFTTLNVDQRVKEALPPRASFLASPLSGQVEGFVKSSVNKVLASEQFARLWPEMNRVAHTQVMAILNNDSTVVRSSGDTVTLNLLPIVNNVLTGLEQQAPTLFGKSLNLPTITNGQIPAGLQTKIESALGVTLPASFAAIPIYQGDQLSAAQNAVVKMKQYVGLLVVGSVIALLLALLVSPRRRRTTLQFGLWLIISVVTLTTVLRNIRAQLIDQVPSGVYRSGVDAGVQIVFVTLRERGTQLLWLGIVIAVVAYLVGPGRGAVAVRHGSVEAAHFLSQRTRRYSAVVVAQGPGYAQAHLDPLRIGGAVAAGVLLLFFTSWTGLFVILVALGLYELLVTAAAASAHEDGEETARPSAREQSPTRGGTVTTA
jgi:hypothetical protein